MIIDILTNADQEPNGSFTGVTSKTIWGDSRRIGVGGAELALLTMCEEWTKAGHTVTLYNNPWEYGASPFAQCRASEFNVNAKRDVLIVFRSPVLKAIAATGMKVWWSTDQYSVGDYREFAGYMDKIVCISDFHADYFNRIYGIKTTQVIDLPVRSDDFKDTCNKTPGRIIFTSVPDRGLYNLWRIWPRIQKKIPTTSLVITSDYRLWGTGANNERYRSNWMSHSNFQFLGALPRDKYLEELSKAEIMLYPCNYDELFCISVAEAQYANVATITSCFGALVTTNMGYKIAVDPTNPNNDQSFVNATVNALLDEDLNVFRYDIAKQAKKRFSPKTILKEWNKKVFK